MCQNSNHYTVWLRNLIQLFAWTLQKIWIVLTVPEWTIFVNQKLDCLGQVLASSPGSTQLFIVTREKRETKSWVEPGDAGSQVQYVLQANYCILVAITRSVIKFCTVHGWCLSSWSRITMKTIPRKITLLGVIWCDNKITVTIRTPNEVTQLLTHEKKGYLLLGWVYNVYTHLSMQIRCINSPTEISRFLMLTHLPWDNTD